MSPVSLVFHTKNKLIRALMFEAQYIGVPHLNVQLDKGDLEQY